MVIEVQEYSTTTIVESRIAVKHIRTLLTNPWNNKWRRHCSSVHSCQWWQLVKMKIEETFAINQGAIVVAPILGVFPQMILGFDSIRSPSLVLFQPKSAGHWCPKTFPSVQVSVHEVKCCAFSPFSSENRTHVRLVQCSKSPHNGFASLSAGVSYARKIVQRFKISALKTSLKRSEACPLTLRPTRPVPIGMRSESS